MNVTSLAIKFGALVLGLGIFFVLFKKIKKLKKFGLPGLLYVLSTGILLSIPILLLLIHSADEMLLLIYYQTIIIIVGILHVRFSEKLVPYIKDLKFGIHFIFILCILIFGYLFSNLTFELQAISSSVKAVWHLSLLWFLVPILINLTIQKLLEVPPKQFKKWQYPLNKTIYDPTDEEMANPVVISFIFQKNELHSDITTFRAKAPVGMALGRLFYFFINDYNERHPEDMISFQNENNESEFWIFFKLKNKFFKWKEALDPDDSIYNSNIKENDVLICKRVR